MDIVIDEAKLMSRIIARVMPILMLVYLVAVIDRSNIGFASAAAVVMLGITLVIFLPIVSLTAWQARRQAARAT